MDMLASFLASNYALYASGQVRPGMYYPFSYHPQTGGYSMSPDPPARSSPLPTDQNKTSPKSSESPAHSSNDKVKFSIESILAEKDDIKVKEDESNDVHVDDDWDLDDEGSSNQDGEQSDSQKFSWLQCTRYKPPKLPRLKKKDGVKKRKLGRNPRVPFTQHQVAVLEQKFRRTHYLSSMDVAELSTALNLTETRVKIWFQNRRARERRDREAIQRGQVIQPRSSPGSTVSGVSWTFPSPHTAFMNLRESLQLSSTSFPVVSMPK